MTKEELEKTEWVHYGKTKFDPKLFRDITNISLDKRGQSRYGLPCKPFGGLWASPVNSDYGWKQWCDSEMEDGFLGKEIFIFKLKPESRVYTIDTVSDLERINKKYSFKPVEMLDMYFFDFEKMKKDGYDGLFLTDSGERRTRLANTLVSFYGWDCESILIFNKDCIIPK